MNQREAEESFEKRGYACSNLDLFSLGNVGEGFQRILRTASRASIAFLKLASAC